MTLEFPANDSFYDVIFRRRDVRRQFVGQDFDPKVLARILLAAHHAPSVGLSQPWDFIIVRNDGVKRKFFEHVMDERDKFEASLPEDKKRIFRNIKIEGILESAVSIIVTYDESRFSPHVLGRQSVVATGVYSVCLAIQNLWLAATTEGYGVGWVSFYEESFVKELLEIPDNISVVAWLCVGPVTHFEDTPDLVRHNWANRLNLQDLLHFDTWTNSSVPEEFSI